MTSFNFPSWRRPELKVHLLLFINSPKEFGALGTVLFCSWITRTNIAIDSGKLRLVFATFPKVDCITVSSRSIKPIIWALRKILNGNYALCLSSLVTVWTIKGNFYLHLLFTLYPISSRNDGSEGISGGTTRRLPKRQQRYSYHRRTEGGRVQAS